MTKNSLTAHVITSAADIAQFLLAGNATFTLVSTSTKARFTYRVSRADGEDKGRPWFVGLLTGSDNEHSYSYAGCMFPGSFDLRFGRKSKVSPEAPSMKALTWFLANLGAAVAGKSNKLSQVEFYHEGRCGRCGRKLTVPTSVVTGLGPDCAAALGIPMRDLAAESDALVAEAEAKGLFDEQDEGEGPDPEDEPERRALQAAYASTY